MEALALKVMNAYERENEDEETLFLPVGVLSTPDRNRAFYAPLFEGNGDYKDAFLTEASETLGLWIEQSFGDTLFVHGGIPHNSDFAFDLLSVVQGGEKQFLRIVQVKATERNLYVRSREAAIKFGALHRGEYAAVLKAHLEIMRYDSRVPEGVNLDEVFFHRRYRVIALHGEDRGGITLLANFSDHVPGGREVRSVHLIRVAWPDFWADLAGRVYAKLS